jgi:hypothetical protein
VVTLDFAKRSMELVDILFLAIMAIVMVTSSIVFAFLQWRWSLPGHGDSQQHERSVILLPFWTTRLAARFGFAESKFREKAIIS